jgi:hypothetical protein
MAGNYRMRLAFYRNDTKTAGADRFEAIVVAQGWNFDAERAHGFQDSTVISEFVSLSVNGGAEHGRFDNRLAG